MTTLNPNLLPLLVEYAADQAANEQRRMNMYVKLGAQLAYRHADDRRSAWATVARIAAAHQGVDHYEERHAAVAQLLQTERGRLEDCRRGYAEAAWEDDAAVCEQGIQVLDSILTDFVEPLHAKDD